MTLKISSKIRDQGLHITAGKAWQMVPFGGNRVLTVKGTSRLTPQVRNTKILKAVQTGDTLKLKGLMPGRTHIDWKSTSNPTAPGFSLEVSVKKQKRIKTAFFYVDDGRVQKTRRKPADAAALIRDANKYLTPQSNVKLILKSAKPLKIKKNLGKVVRFSSHLKNVDKSQHEWDDLIAHRDKTADFNVFFVKEYEQDETPLKDNVEAGTLKSDKSCIFEDVVVPDIGNVLAHETVHLLGVDKHSNTTRNLMKIYRPGRGHINKEQANKINPSGAK